MSHRSHSLYLIPNFLGEASSDAVFPLFNLTILESVTFFLAENPKEARRLLKTTCPLLDLRSITIQTLNKNTTDGELKELMKPLISGNSMGIISDAGCPAVADPGSQAVMYAHQSGISVKPLIGPCSMLLALMASGLYGQRWRFQGYLPVALDARGKILNQLEKRSQKEQETQIFMETPYRNQKLFEQIKATCNPSTFLCIAQDLTTPQELIQTKRVGDWNRIETSLRKAPAVFLLASGL
jgi:16S rRNA (cytidine1402-2'-O)-methyltransferase